MRGSPVPDPSRGHDVSGLTTAELERARRDLKASLALARPGSAAYVPIFAHLSAIDAELAGRSAGCGASEKPSGLGARTPGDAGPATGELLMTGPNGAPPAGEVEVPEPIAVDVGQLNLPTPYAAARIAAFLDRHLCWTAFWDKNYRVWRVAENDPDSDLYAESRDADAVIKYMTAHS